MGRERTLRSRILVPLAWALAPTLLILLAASSFDYQREMRAVDAHADDVAQRAALRLDEVLVDARHATDSLALWAQGAGAGQDCGAALDRILAQQAAVQNLGLLDAQGRVRCAHDPAAVPPNLDLRRSWQSLQEGQPFAVADFEWTPSRASQALVFLHAVGDPDADFQGAAFAIIPPTAFASALRQDDLLQDADLILADSRGCIIAGDDRHAGLVGYYVFGSPLFDAFRSAHPPATVETRGAASSEPRLWTLQVLPGTESRPVHAAVGLDVEAARTAASARLALNTAGAVALVVLAAVVAGVALDRYVSRPIHRLAAQAAQPVAELAIGPAPPKVGVHEIDALASVLRQAGQRIAEDLAERSRQQELLERTNRELEHFAYVASHDLQEPLRKVVSFNELLLDEYADRLDGQGRHYLERSLSSAQRMRDLVREVLSFSRLDKDTSRDRRLDMESLLREVLADLRPALEESGAVVMAQPLPAVNANPTQVASLLQNLLDNAIKYRAPGHAPRIQVGTRQVGEKRAFFVQDDGIGIPLDGQAKLFQLFQRLHARDAYPGTGIGLASCKKIVERHGGRIWVESAPGQGTTFLFTLPLANGPAPSASAKPETTPLPIRPQQRWAPATSPAPPPSPSEVPP